MRTNSQRNARIARATSETDIELELVLDGSGRSDIDTGIGFFDHMLTALARHGCFDLQLRCKGDLQVDQHHTVEDVGICLGQAIDKALGTKEGITRFGHAYVPMDAALARVVVDLSGRSYLVLEPSFEEAAVGEFSAGLVVEFFRAVADHGNANIHIDLLRAANNHHSIEAIFKAFGRALDSASLLSPRVQGVPSTKGSL